MRLFLISIVLSIQFIELPNANAFELLGLVAYDIGSYTPKPSNYVNTQNGLGYAFFGRLDLGPGKVESGFIYTPTSITTRTPSQSFDIKTAGSYWILPVLYRYSFYEPFFSIAVGLDYAFIGNTAVSVVGTPINNPATSGYQSNFGGEISFEASQDLGENLSLVFDARYRRGFQNAITFENTTSKFHFVMLALGLQKAL